jgi:polyadenylate-binding protein 2
MSTAETTAEALKKSPMDNQEEEEDEEDLEQLQAEIARMEEEAARITQETAALEQRKEGIASGTSTTTKVPRDGHSIYVGQVDYSATPEELLKHFEACGTVERVTIVWYVLYTCYANHRLMICMYIF